MRRLARRWLPPRMKRWVRRSAPALSDSEPPTEQPPFEWPFRLLLDSTRGSRQHYLWGAYYAASIARTLGYARISMVEFGVAGGNGLVALEQAAENAENRSGVKIEVYGFDTGTGLPKPQDYRDLPHLWHEGDYRMDVTKLRSRLRRA